MPRMSAAPLKESEDPELVAAVDLGSNSFHLLVGRVVQTPVGPQISPIDSLKDAVRLASGLSADKRLDAASQSRAVLALQRFGERLRLFHPQRVRAVATNTFRVAKNGPSFLKTCEAALGFPIEVIAGKEEARLIYNGVAHTLAADGRRRLVIDIGGGSTEMIIGTDYRPELLESVFIGCIRFTREFFPDGQVSRSGFREAVLAARKEIQVASGPFRALGWEMAVGSSGTARAIADVVAALGDRSYGITLSGMEEIRARLVKAGRVEQADLPGIKPDRMPVFVGGLSIMIALFEELAIDRMQYSEGALRLGVLYDVLGRARHDDMRVYTVEQFVKRYAVDTAQAQRVSDLALLLWGQVALGSQEERQDMAQLLNWSAQLLEVGHSISHNSYHKHSAYIVSQSDMPGFSRRDQQVMSGLVLGHVGKLGKVQSLFVDRFQRLALICLRLAAIFYRSRASAQLPTVRLQTTGKGVALTLDADWLEHHPLTRFTLNQEQAEWAKMNLLLEIYEESTDFAKSAKSR
jgi:exopolyphosphatase/guanosine-5'-triphosphate,3'-diphosphate pyrophosphatase